MQTFRYRTEWSRQAAGDCPGATCPVAVYNGTTDKVLNVSYLAIQPLSVNDGSAGIFGAIHSRWLLNTLTAVSGGTAVSYAKGDTTADDLPAAVKWVVGPQATTEGTTLRRFLVAPFVDAAGVIKTVMGLTDYFHGSHGLATADFSPGGTSDATRLILREGEGVTIRPQLWPSNHSTTVSMIVRDTANGAIYATRIPTLYGVADQGWLSFFNGAGSGKIYELVSVALSQTGHVDQISQFSGGRVLRFFNQPGDGDTLTAIKLDTAETVPAGVQVVRNARLPDWNGAIKYAQLQEAYEGQSYLTNLGALSAYMTMIPQGSMRPFLLATGLFINGIAGSGVATPGLIGDCVLTSYHGSNIQAWRLNPGEGIAVVDCHLGVTSVPGGPNPSQWTPFRSPSQRLMQGNPWNNFDVAVDIAIENYVASASGSGVSRSRVANQAS